MHVLLFLSTYFDLCNLHKNVVQINCTDYNFNWITFLCYRSLLAHSDNFSLINVSEKILFSVIFLRI